MPTDTSWTYRIAGVTLRSEVCLPELGAGVIATAPDWSFRVGTHHPRAPREGWFHHWPDSTGRRWLSFGRDASTYVLRFARLATFRLTPALGTIVCEGASRVPRKTLRHLLLNQVIPFALSRRGGFVLHASAVADDAGVIGFVGDTGSGKSTLSAALALSGCRFIGDDALAITSEEATCAVLPMYPSVRLWPDSLRTLFRKSSLHPTVSHYSNKRLVPLHTATECASEPLALRVLCLLSPRRRGSQSKPVTVRELSPRDAVIRLTGHAFQLDVYDMDRMKTDFERLAAIAQRVPVVELSYRWRLGRVRETASEVAEALAHYE